MNPERETKSVSSETTFDDDIADFRFLEQTLFRLAEKVSARLKAAELSGRTVTLEAEDRGFPPASPAPARWRRRRSFRIASSIPPASCWPARPTARATG